MNILNEIETSWKEFKYSTNEFHDEILFYNTFESIVYYSYQWIQSYFHLNTSQTLFNSLLIPFDQKLNPDEYFCQLISYSSQSSIKDLYIEKWLKQSPSTSLLFYFNIRSTNLLFGLYDKMTQQIEFWSKFLWLNGSFLQCNRSTLEECLRNCLENRSIDSTDLCLELIKQSLKQIELIRPRGEIDPVIYEQIINDYQIKFHQEIDYEYNLRICSKDKYEYSLNHPIHQWENRMKIILNQIQIEEKEFYRFNNEQYQMLIIYLTKQLIDELLNQNLLIEQILKKIKRKFINNGEKILSNFIEV